VSGAASRIAINADIAANSRHIAAGAPTAGPGPAASGDNSNALALTALATTQTAFYLTGDPPGPATGTSQTFSSFLSSTAGALGADLQNVRLDLQKGDLVIAELGHCCSTPRIRSRPASASRRSRTTREPLRA